MSNWDTCLFRNSNKRETHITVINVTHLHKKMQQADDAFALIAPTISAQSTRLLTFMLVSSFSNALDTMQVQLLLHTSDCERENTKNAAGVHRGAQGVQSHER